MSMLSFLVETEVRVVLLTFTHEAFHQRWILFGFVLLRARFVDRQHVDRPVTQGVHQVVVEAILLREHRLRQTRCGLGVAVATLEPLDEDAAPWMNLEGSHVHVVPDDGETFVYLRLLGEGEDPVVREDGEGGVLTLVAHLPAGDVRGVDERRLAVTEQRLLVWRDVALEELHQRHVLAEEFAVDPHAAVRLPVHDRGPVVAEVPASDDREVVGDEAALVYVPTLLEHRVDGLAGPGVERKVVLAVVRLLVHPLAALIFIRAARVRREVEQRGGEPVLRVAPDLHAGDGFGRVLFETHLRPSPQHSQQGVEFLGGSEVTHLLRLSWAEVLVLEPAPQVGGDAAADAVVQHRQSQQQVGVVQREATRALLLEFFRSGGGTRRGLQVHAEVVRRAVLLIVPVLRRELGVPRGPAGLVEPGALVHGLERVERLEVVPALVLQRVEHRGAGALGTAGVEEASYLDVSRSVAVERTADVAAGGGEQLSVARRQFLRRVRRQEAGTVTEVLHRARERVGELLRPDGARLREFGEDMRGTKVRGEVAGLVGVEEQVLELLPVRLIETDARDTRGHLLEPFLQSVGETVVPLREEGALRLGVQVDDGRLIEAALSDRLRDVRERLLAVSADGAGD